MECNRPQECCHPVHEAIAGPWVGPTSENFCEDKVVQNDTAVTSGSMGFEEMADETQERAETQLEASLRVRVLQLEADVNQQYQSNQDLAREALAWKEVAERYGKALDLIHREAVK